jgi:hypothetical protein
VSPGRHIATTDHLRRLPGRAGIAQGEGRAVGPDTLSGHRRVHWLDKTFPDGPLRVPRWFKDLNLLSGMGWPGMTFYGYRPSRLAIQAAINQVWTLSLGESDRRQWAGPISSLNMSARWSKIPRCPVPWRMTSRAVGMCSCSQYAWAGLAIRSSSPYHR